MRRDRARVACAHVLVVWRSEVPRSPRGSVDERRLFLIPHHFSADHQVGYAKFENLKLVRWGWGYTRSHSEHGSQAHYHRWYSALRGRVGRRQLQVFKPKNRANARFFSRLARTDKRILGASQDPLRYFGTCEQNIQKVYICCNK